MARNEHLPIYKAAYDLCLWLEQVVRGFSRYHKYAIGSDLREGSRRILRLVVRANARIDKAPVLLEIREEVEELKAMLRLCNDAKGFNGIAAFEHGARLVVDVARQNEGWLKSAQARQSADRQEANDVGRGQNRSSASRETAAAPAGAP
jgi:hypothetical protein